MQNWFLLPRVRQCQIQTDSQVRSQGNRFKNHVYMQKNTLQQKILHLLCGRPKMWVQLQLRGLLELRQASKDRDVANMRSG
jgi:hypothetical protein